MADNLPARLGDDGGSFSNEKDTTFCGTFKNGREAGRRVCFYMARAARALADVTSIEEGWAQQAYNLGIFDDAGTELDPSGIYTEIAEGAVRRVHESRITQGKVNETITQGIPVNRRCASCHLFGTIEGQLVGRELEGSTAATQLGAYPT